MVDESLIHTNGRDMIPSRDQGSKEFARNIRAMFDSIAHRYDLLNHINSFGLDILWRKDIAQRISAEKPSLILDLAAGTGDLTIELARRNKSATVVAADLSLGMLEKALHKAKREHLQKVKISVVDALDLPFGDNHFDAITCAFGVRNFSSIPDGLKEMHRVIRPGGMVAILELCEPENPILHSLYRVHADLVIPTVSRIVSGNNSAYNYLADSITVVPNRDVMQYLLEEAGFRHTYYKIYSPGVCGLYVGYKPRFEEELGPIRNRFLEENGLA